MDEWSQNQPVTLATLATLATYLQANWKQETNHLYKPLQFNDVTSCQLQPFLYNIPTAHGQVIRLFHPAL
jgi:hypothetical protein